MIDLRTITASAITVSQLAGVVNHAEIYADLPVVSSVSIAPVHYVSGTTENTDIARSASIQLAFPANRINRWTRIEKDRYRKLVVKFASAGLSETEENELNELEIARSRFEDQRSSQEIIEEFRMRRLYAGLLTSLANASAGLKH